MLVRYAGRSVEIRRATPQAFRGLFTAQDVRDKLQTATLELARESANGPSLALRRLGEKVTRLSKRLANEETLLRDASDNQKRKTRP